MLIAQVYFFIFNRVFQMLKAMKFCAFSILLSCSTIPNDIQTEYAATARRLGLVPVFPPREEFQIGDMFVVSYGEDPNDSVNVWVGEYDQIATIANEHMNDRIVFRQTTGETTATNQLAQTDTFGRGLSRRKDIRIETLPIAAYPAITADAGITAGLGIAKTLAALGLGGGQRTKVTLNFGDVRTYWAPKVKVAAYEGELDSAFGQAFVNSENALRRALDREIALSKNSGRNLSDERCLGAVVITRVYLTRKIIYTYSNGRIIAAGIRRAESGATISGIPAPSRVTVNVSNTNGQIEQATPDAEIENLRNQIDALAGEDNQGVGLNFESWSALGVSFSQDFPRPVAIGYDGFSFPITIEGEGKCQFQPIKQIHSKPPQ